MPQNHRTPTCPTEPTSQTHCGSRVTCHSFASLEAPPRPTRRQDAWPLVRQIALASKSASYAPGATTLARELYVRRMRACYRCVVYQLSLRTPSPPPETSPALGCSFPCNATASCSRKRLLHSAKNGHPATSAHLLASRYVVRSYARANAAATATYAPATTAASNSSGLAPPAALAMGSVPMPMRPPLVICGDVGRGRKGGVARKDKGTAAGKGRSAQCCPRNRVARPQ
mmetsp:Transcript_38137/g.112971  ORF Transcript_38137/g.112971 Transcript_38137/m.112971 type:complete len:229 (-) Transcript_38137:1268-1954(-)